MVLLALHTICQLFRVMDLFIDLGTFAPLQHLCLSPDLRLGLSLPTGIVPRLKANKITIPGQFHVSVFTVTLFLNR